MSPTDEFPHDDEHKTGSEEGDWVSNEPPVDDFGDSSAEEATVSESNDHAHEDTTAGAAAVPETKRKSPLMLVGGVLVGLGLVAGIGYWQFGGHKQEQTSLLDMAAQSDTPPMNDVMKPAASSPSSTTAAALASAPSVAPTTAFGASATPDIPPIAKLPMPQNGSATSDTAVASLPPSAAVSSAPPVAAAPIPAAPQSAPVPAVSNAGTDARLAALSSRIDDLQKSLSQATQQMGQISDKLTQNQIPAAPAAAAPASSDTATTERLDKLEQKLIQIEQHPASSAHYASSEEVAPVRTTHRAKRHVEKSKTTHHRANKPDMRAVENGSSSAWVLRAATPDEAWVAKSPSSRELRPVHIGDDLPGVGKVTMIRQDGNSWSLQGTNGVVH